MAKKSLLYFTNDSSKEASVKANSYVVANVGYFFQDVADRRAEIVIEGDLNISLKDAFIVIKEEEAKQLQNEKANPNAEMLKLKQENEELKKKLEESGADELLKENESLKAELETLKAELETLKLNLAESQAENEKLKKKTITPKK